MFANLRHWFTGPRKATVFLLLAQLIAAGGALLVNIFASRTLDPTDRGNLAFALQVAYFLTVFAMMGLERPFIAVRKGSFHQEFQAITRLVAPGALVVFPLAIGVTFFTPLGEAWPLIALFLIGLFTVFNVVVRNVRVAYLASDDWRIFTRNAIATQLILLFAAVLLSYLLITDPTIWMLAYIASTLPSVWLLIRSFIKEGAPVSIPNAKEMRKKGWALLPSDFSNTAMTRTDRLLLPILGTPAQLGLYVTVATVMEVASWPAKQWADASLREWTADNKGLYSRIKWIILRTAGFLILAAMIMGAAAYIMLKYLLPPAYESAIPLILPLGVASLLLGLTRIQQGILVALGEAARVSMLEIMGTTVSVIAYFVLIPQLGEYGAVAGMALGYAVCFLFGVAVVFSKIKRSAS